MPCAQVQTDFISLSLLCSCLEELSQLLVSGFARLVHQCHAKTHISPFAAWHQGSSGLEHYLGRQIVDLATHARERSRRYCRYERDRGRLIQPSLRALPLMCKVGLSLIVDNALEFGKYFRFILQWPYDRQLDVKDLIILVLIQVHMEVNM